jgi:hypothetical protein
MLVLTQAPLQSVSPAPQLASQTSVMVLHTCPAAHVDVPASQVSAPSLQLSVPLQATPSPQLRAAPPVHAAAAEQVSPVVQ